MKPETEIARLKKKLAKLEAEFEQWKKESVKWCVEDFTMYQMEGMQITRAQAQEALERMIYKHDANEGIHWITIEHYLEQYGTEVKVGKERWRKYCNNDEDED